MSADKKSYWKEQLAQARTEFKELLLSLTEEQLRTSVISEGSRWTPLDLASHLLENERGMSIHVHKIRQGRETVPENFDLQEWNRGLKKRMGDPPPLEELLESMEQARARTLQELESLEDEEWTLTGRHPRSGMITIEQYYETMVGHDRWHTRDIKKGLGLAE